MIGYRVNNRVFYNPYLARYEQYKTGNSLHFHCYDIEYSKLDWSREPEQTLEQLMDSHVHYLRNKYERLIFMWSGGTDSHTMWNVFKRNNIHIDEIIVKHSQVVEYIQYSSQYADWIIKNHYDPTTKITLWEEYDLSFRGIVVNNEDWVLQDKGDLFKFGQSAISNATIDHCEKNHNGHNWGLVVGADKPRIDYINGHWYAGQVDTDLLQFMGHNRVECFFLDPIINLKQSHLAKNCMKIMRTAGDISNPALSPAGPGELTYWAWTKNVGRHDELIRGASYSQKKFNHLAKQATIDITVDPAEFDPKFGEEVLIAKLKSQDSTALNYIRGFYNLCSDQKFMDFMNKKHLKGKNQILNLVPLWSKKYYLGE